MAAILEYAGLTPGARVAHVGAGLGYYTALIAEIAGEAGSVVALELESELASRARTNLASYSNARCVCADGSSYQLPQNSFDVVVVSAGASQLQLTWLKSLRDGGRLVVPLVFSNDEPGQVARVTRHGDRFHVEFVMDAIVYPCQGSDEQTYADRLREAVETFGWYSNTELRLDLENTDDSAWLITSTYWISMIERDTTGDPVRLVETSLTIP
jgi:protein-L-isoaspartate(D-aspartate) O-methyltransferase